MVLPFDGTRLTLVFFTRPKYLTLNEKFRMRLEGAGFRLLGAEWEPKVS